MIITLTGFMGCGKSTVGRILADRLAWDFVDLDSYIEHKKGLSIPDFISSEGEQAFRMVEGDCLRDVVAMSEIRGRNTVVALGGGTICTVALRPLLLERTKLVYLKADEACLEQRLASSSANRPLLKNNRISDLLEIRRPLYEMAQLTVDTNGKEPEQIAETIKNAIL